jgi:hypothetical protein
LLHTRQLLGDGHADEVVQGYSIALGEKLRLFEVRFWKSKGEALSYLTRPQCTTSRMVLKRTNFYIVGCRDFPFKNFLEPLSIVTLAKRSLGPAQDVA